MAERSLFSRLFYNTVKVTSQAFCRLWFSIRYLGRELPPKEGAAVVCSNHQSYLDPIVVGCAFKRRLNFLARKTLFDFGPFGWFIRALDAIPLDRDGISLSGIKETLKRLRRGELVLIFPEGTRTPDGEVHDFQPGVMTLIRRGRAAVVPVGVDGAFQAWPRDRRWPRRERVRVVIGEAITAEDVAAMNDDQLLAKLQQSVTECWAEARRARQPS